MSDSTIPPEQRAFNCPHCNGRIVIPANLPPTTGPCPHCQGTITSPEPVLKAAVIQEEPKPQAQIRPEPIPATKPVETPEPTPAETHEDKEHEELEVKAKAKPSKSAKSTKGKSPATLILVILILVLGLGAGGYFIMDMLKPKDSPPTVSPMPQPKPSANPTLIKYLAAATLEDKLNHVLNAEVLRPKMEAFYKAGMLNETGTPASAFTFVKLPEADSKKGFVLFSYDQPTKAAPNAQGQTKPPTPANPLAPRTKILAFLKETEQGVKLDWEVFAQTKYRTYSQFIKTPVIGKSEVFRLVVTRELIEKSATPPTNSSYEFADPAHLGDIANISPDPKSQAGQALAALDADSIRLSSEIQRTATVELTWAGDPKAPQLEIKRFICWEFVGLGGKETAETPPSN